MGNSCAGLCNHDDVSSAPVRDPSKTPSDSSEILPRSPGKSIPEKEACGSSTLVTQENQFGRMNTLDNKAEELAQAGLENHQFLKHLSFKKRKILISKLNRVTFAPNETILDLKTATDFLYILQSGTVKAILQNSESKLLTKGQSLDSILLTGKITQVTFVSMNHCVLWVLDNQSLQAHLEAAKRTIYKINHRVMKDINIFRELNNKEFDKLLSVAETIEFPSDAVILRENEKGDQLFVIKSGAVMCSVKNKNVREMHELDYFGEVALFGGSRRMATVTSIKPVTLLCFERAKITSVLGNSLEKIVIDNCLRFSIERSKFLSILTGNQINQMKQVAQIIKFPAGRTVIPAHTEKSEALYSVLKGSLLSKNKIIGNLKCIGDKHILKPSEKTYKNSIMANVESIVAIYTREDLEEALNIHLKQLKSMNTLMSLLEKISVFQFVPKWKMQDIANAVELHEFHPEAYICKEKEEPKAIYILKKGTIVMTRRRKNLREVRKHSYFGERSILLNEPWTASAVATNPVQCWVLAKDKLFAFLDELIMRQMIRRAKLQDDSITLEDLQPIEDLQRGALGRRILTVHSKSQIQYAVYYMDIEELKEEAQFKRTEKEKSILSTLDHSLVVKTIRMLKDSKRIYMVSEHIRGWDLCDIMRDFHLLRCDESKFYIACLILALKYLHSHKIMYRDLKPERVIIDKEGYPKLVDFEFAKVIKGRTYTQIGDPYYMAPEAILGRDGYSFNADIWSLGVIFYELLYGKAPFNIQNADIMTMYQNIIQTDLDFPENCPVKKEAKSLIKKMLKKIPYLRFDAKDCKKHDWFRGIEWKDIILRNFRPPFLPDVGSVRGFKPNSQRNSKTLVEYIQRMDLI